MIEAVGKSGLPIDIRELAAEDVRPSMERLARDGVRRVAVAGGDGTIAIGAALASKLGMELAVIPGGTLNHLAKDLGIPEALDDALRLALTGEARPVDAGSVNGHLFLNTSSVGTYVTFVRMRERLERFLGYRLASIVAAIRLLIRPRAFTVELEVEGQMRSDVTPLVFIGVSERELKLPTLGGRATNGRRGLHLMIVRGRSRARFAALAFAAAARGTRSATRSPALDAFIVNKLTIRMRRPHVYVATDGELHAMSGPLEFAWVADAVKVVVPR
ncbi:MAG TPA: diacylglycerol kinase family protein [Gemmatimonadaceae bacterium]|nr:diacylglycerol kinase family protein [Gemmatimonadaceae bacterium]